MVKGHKLSVIKGIKAEDLMSNVVTIIGNTIVKMKFVNRVNLNVVNNKNEKYVKRWMC